MGVVPCSLDGKSGKIPLPSPLLQIAFLRSVFIYFVGNVKKARGERVLNIISLKGSYILGRVLGSAMREYLQPINDLVSKSLS